MYSEKSPFHPWLPSSCPGKNKFQFLIYHSRIILDILKYIITHIFFCENFYMRGSLLQTLFYTLPFLLNILRIFCIHKLKSYLILYYRCISLCSIVGIKNISFNQFPYRYLLSEFCHYTMVQHFTQWCRIHYLTHPQLYIKNKVLEAWVAHLLSL